MPAKKKGEDIEILSRFAVFTVAVPTKYASDFAESFKPGLRLRSSQNQIDKPQDKVIFHLYQTKKMEKSFSEFLDSFCKRRDITFAKIKGQSDS